MSNIISAGNLRLMGISVPEHIPDCALCHYGDMEISCHSTDEEIQQRILSLDISITSPSFSWVEMNCTVLADNNKNKKADF